SRPQKVKQQHTAREVGIIPSFMLGGVVEDQASPLLPGPRLSGHPQAAARRDDKRQMESVNARRPADVRLDVGPWREPRKAGHRQPRHLLERSGGLRTCGTRARNWLADRV